jgi:DNA replication protein DnaC
MEDLSREIHTAMEGIPRGKGAKMPQCPFCEDTGWERVWDKENTVKRCRCMKDKILKMRIRQILENWKEYADASMDNFKPRTAGQERAINAIREDPAGSFFIHGTFSQGKTRLMICQFRRLAELGIQCEIRTAKELIRELQLADAPVEVGKTAFESPVLKLANLAPNGHLFIDDIEKAGARSGFRVEALFSLFDTIKRRKIGLTFTSNMPFVKPKGLSLTTEMSDQIVSRLDAICTKVLDLG